MHEIICLVVDQFEIVPVLNGKSGEEQVVSATLFGGAYTHLEKAGVFVALGSGNDVIVKMCHLSRSGS